MATVASIITNLRANTGQFDKALDGAKRRTTDFAKHVNNSTLAGLKKSLGEESGIGQIGKVLRGAGAVGGLAAVSAAFLNTARHAAELRKQMLDGELTVSQYKRRLFELVPVLGQVAQAGRETGESIREFLKSRVEWAVEANVKGQGKSGEATNKAIGDVMSDNRAAQLAAMTEQNRAIEEEAERHKKRQEAIFAEMPSLQNKQMESQINLAAARAQHGRNSPQFEDAEAAARQAMANRNNFEAMANRASEMEAQTHAMNMEKIRQAAQDRTEDIEAQARKDREDREDAVIEREEQRAKAAADLAERNRAQFISGATGHFERLKSMQDQPVQFASAAVAGSQEEFAMRQRSLFGGQVARGNDKELAKEAVELHKRELAELQQVTDLLRESARNTNVVDF